MSGPWEDFQPQESGTPWADFAPKVGRYGTGQSFDVVGEGQLAPTGSSAAQAASSPVAGNSFLQNAQIGVGKFYTDALLGVRQLYGQATGNNQAAVTDPITGLNAADKRVIDVPVAGTWGGKVGQMAAVAPLALIPGLNTYAGAAAMGGATGALQPTVGNESRLLNTGIGVASGATGKYAGDVLGNWLTQRAAQPFMGWNQRTGNQAAAQAVGSQAGRLDQPAIAQTAQRFEQVFGAARDPNVSIPLTSQTQQRITTAAAGLNQSSRQALEANHEVVNLTMHLQNGTANAEQLGAISSRLGNEAASQMSSRVGDRQLGQALFAVKEHVDDLIGQSISSPELKAAYAAARPQYRTFLTLTNRPTLLNSSTGDVNLRNLGNYLQRYDKAGYLRGGNTSPLYQAARWGQASGIGSRPPPPILQPVKWGIYHAVNNPVVGMVGGTVSRVGAPLAPVLRPGLQGLAVGSEPVLLPYLEE